jgi:phage baseplate assembly protein W
MSEIRAFSDLNMDFIAHPLTGNVTPLDNIDSIAQSIRTIFKLRSGDIPFAPNKWVGLESYLFEPIDSATGAVIAKRIEWMIQQLEPRVLLYKVQVTPTDDETGYEITVTYRIRALNTDVSVTEFFTRVR